MDLIGDEPRLLPFFLLCIQAGDDMILKRMKRRHNRADAVAICTEIRRLRPDAVLGADLIAGFPTESDDMFDNTLALIGECGLTHLHVFPYSPRKGTPAAHMPQVPIEIRRERAAKLRTAGARGMARLLESREDRAISVLVEKDRSGHCEHYLPVDIDRDAAPGSIVAARVNGQDGKRLMAAVQE